LIPVIILGGIYGGFFTPTEAAVVAVFYGLFVGFVIYRTINIKKLYTIFVEASVHTEIVMLVVSIASIFSSNITHVCISRYIIYRTINIKNLYTIFVEASVQTAIVMFVVSMASVFAHIITTERYARDIADSLLSISDSPIVILLIINVILLIAGAFIDAISA